MKGGNKLNAHKTTVDGIVFASKKEADRYVYLREREKRGEISALRCQVPFELIPKQTRDDGKTERACSYVCDFAYNEYLPDECRYRYVVEDVKGYKGKGAVWQVFSIKKKLMLYRHGITVHIV